VNNIRKPNVYNVSKHLLMFTRRNILASLSISPLAMAADPVRRIGVAQIGTRHAHANGKLAAVLAQPESYQVLGLADVEPSESAVYKGLPRLPIPQLLALPGLQLVLVESDLADACRYAMLAIEAGKHVHLDKPGAVDHAEFTKMRLAAEAKGLTVQMGYMLRYNPAFELLKRCLTEGWLGEVTEIDAMMGKFADPALRTQLAGLAGGGMFELGCHMVDAVVGLLGKPRAVQALSTPTGADGMKDNQLAVLEYAGATVTLRCNHVDPFGGQRRRFSLTGTKGSIEIMPMESGRLMARFDSVHPGFRKGEQAVKLEMPKGRYDREFTDFARVIRGGRLTWDAAHDIAVHETVLKAAGL
jgi:predicted dehydrogenase